MIDLLNGCLCDIIAFIPVDFIDFKTIQEYKYTFKLILHRLHESVTSLIQQLFIVKQRTACWNDINMNSLKDTTMMLVSSFSYVYNGIKKYCSKEIKVSFNIVCLNSFLCL